MPKQTVLGKLLLALACAAPIAAAGQTRECAVDRLEGGAELWRAGSWAPLVAGALPAGETKLRTGPGARVEIRCDDGVVLTVAPDAEVNVEALIGPAGRGRDVVLQLIRGLIAVIAPERTWRRLETRTPLAVAAARSTAWLAEVRPDGQVGVFAREGEVAVASSGAAAFAPVVLEPGEGITIAGDGAAGPVVVWGDARVDAARSALGFSWR
jgi:hypothetical protein